MINEIYNGIKRLLFGSTYKFVTRKGSCTLNGASWVEIYKEMTENPVKLISLSFIQQADIKSQYRIMIDGEKIFPFSNDANIENGTTRNFIIPIKISSGSYLQIEVRSDIKMKNVLIMDELAMIEVI